MGYLLAALLGGFFLFNTQVTPDKAAGVMEKTLRQRFPGAQVEAQVEGKRGRDVLKGRFKRVQIKMANFRTSSAPTASAPVPSLRSVARVKSRGYVGRLEVDLRNFDFGEMRVDTLNAGFQDVTFDWKALKNDNRIDMLSCGPATARVTLSTAALEVLLRDRLKDIHDARLSFDAGKLSMTGKRNVPLIDLPVPFSLTGDLEARNGNEIWLAQPALKMSGIPVAAPIAGAFLRNLNPLYVFDRERKLPFRVMIGNIQSRSGALELSGQLQFVPAPPTG